MYTFDIAITFLNKYLLDCNSRYNSSKGTNWSEQYFKSISNLRASQSEDFNGFSDKVMKEITAVIAEPLVFLLNNVFR